MESRWEIRAQCAYDAMEPPSYYDIPELTEAQKAYWEYEQSLFDDDED